jgi:hypothetical protein
MELARADARQYFTIHGFDPLGVTDIPESTVMSMLVSAHSSLSVQGGVRACRGQCGSVLIE